MLDKASGSLVFSPVGVRSPRTSPPPFSSPELTRLSNAAALFGAMLDDPADPNNVNEPDGHDDPDDLDPDELDEPYDSPDEFSDPDDADDFADPDRLIQR